MEQGCGAMLAGSHESRPVWFSVCVYMYLCVCVCSCVWSGRPIGENLQIYHRDALKFSLRGQCTLCLSLSLFYFFHILLHYYSYPTQSLPGQSLFMVAQSLLCVGDLSFVLLLSLTSLVPCFPSLWPDLHNPWSSILH